MTCEYCNKPAPEQVPHLIALKGKKCCIVCASTMPFEFMEALKAKVDPLKRKARNKRRNLRKKLAKKYGKKK